MRHENPQFPMVTPPPSPWKIRSLPWGGGGGGVRIFSGTAQCHLYLHITFLWVLPQKQWFYRHPLHWQNTTAFFFRTLTACGPWLQLGRHQQTKEKHSYDVYNKRDPEHCPPFFSFLKWDKKKKHFFVGLKMLENSGFIKKYHEITCFFLHVLMKIIRRRSMTLLKRLP